MNTQTKVWIGHRPHRQASGLVVENGQSFEASASELAAFGDLMVSVKRAEADGVDVQPASKQSHYSQAKAARTLQENEAKLIASRRKKEKFYAEHGFAEEAEEAESAPESASEDDAAETTGETLEDASSAARSAETVTGAPSFDTIASMTVKELRQLAKDAEIELHGARTKADLVEAIKVFYGEV